MSNETKQTAVEWLAQRLYDLEIAYNQGVINTNTYLKSKREAVEQAKEIHKNEIFEAHYYGQESDRKSFTWDDHPEFWASEYYNKTFK